MISFVSYQRDVPMFCGLNGSVSAYGWRFPQIQFL
jgi:hypothetical protein